MANVLIIEDNPGVLKVLVNIMESAGHHVTSVSDGEEAVRLYQEYSVDLVITDMEMPKMSGIETIQKFRNKDSRLKIIAISGGSEIFGSNAGITSGKLAGADRILIKPFKREKLLAAVEELLAKKCK